MAHPDPGGVMPWDTKEPYRGLVKVYYEALPGHILSPIRPTRQERPNVSINCQHQLGGWEDSLAITAEYQ